MQQHEKISSDHVKRRKKTIYGFEKKDLFLIINIKYAL